MTGEEAKLPQLFMEDVVWDSTPLRMIKSMNEAECRAMVMSTARNLRLSSATIRHTFRDFAELRTRNATFSLHELIGPLSDEDDSRSEEYWFRRRELAEEQLEATYSVLERYRRDAGYRYLCLLGLSADQGHSVETLNSASGLRLLGRAQSAHLDSLMMIDKIRVLHKHSSALSPEVFGAEKLMMIQLLECHLSTLSQVFEKIDTPIEGMQLPDYVKRTAEEHLEWSDSKLPELQMAETAVRVFRKANRQFTSHLWEVMSDYTRANFPEGIVFQAA